MFLLNDFLILTAVIDHVSHTVWVPTVIQKAYWIRPVRWICHSSTRQIFCCSLGGQQFYVSTSHVCIYSLHRAKTCLLSYGCTVTSYKSSVDPALNDGTFYTNITVIKVQLFCNISLYLWAPQCKLALFCGSLCRSRLPMVNQCKKVNT